MAVQSLGVAAPLKFALEVLRQTLKQEQRTAEAISRAGQGEGQASAAASGGDALASGAGASRGTIVDILA